MLQTIFLNSLFLFSQKVFKELNRETRKQNKTSKPKKQDINRETRKQNKTSKPDRM